MKYSATWAVIATNHSASYDFFAPLTALLWREIVGYRTMLFLTGTWEEWRDPVSALIVQKAEELSCRIEWIGKLEGYQDAQAAQSSRQHAAALDWPETEVLITGDIDMWPLSRKWFHQHDLGKYNFCSYYANAYGWPYPPFHPTPYVAATVKNWRKIMDLEVRGEILTQMQANFDRTLGRYHDTWTAWWTDELYFNSKLKAWDGYPDRVQMICREGQPPHDRIDRCAWPSTFDWSREWADTHLIRPGATPENWPRIRPLLEHYIPKQMGWVDKYVRLYQEARYGKR